MDWYTPFLEKHCVLRSINQNWIASFSKVNCCLAEKVCDRTSGLVKYTNKNRIKISLPERKKSGCYFLLLLWESLLNCLLEQEIKCQEIKQVWGPLFSDVRTLSLTGGTVPHREWNQLENYRRSSFGSLRKEAKKKVAKQVARNISEKFWNKQAIHDNGKYQGVQRYRQSR